MPLKHQAGRFAVLQHDHPFLHWDLLLEDGPEAATWRLLRRPVLGEPIAAEPLAPHRLMYLSYTGPVSGGRGFVSPLATGTWQLLTAAGDSQTIQRNSAVSPDSAVQPLPLPVRIRLNGWMGCTTAELQNTADHRSFWTFAESADQRLIPT
ncbi:MAG: hypothetical protein ACK524_22750 [Planctomyces sp.]|jgi:hypothetical protein